MYRGTEERQHTHTHNNNNNKTRNNNSKIITHNKQQKQPTNQSTK